MKQRCIKLRGLRTLVSLPTANFLNIAEMCALFHHFLRVTIQVHPLAWELVHTNFRLATTLRLLTATILPPRPGETIKISRIWKDDTLNSWRNYTVRIINENIRPLLLPLMPVGMTKGYSIMIQRVTSKARLQLESNEK